MIRARTKRALTLVGASLLLVGAGGCQDLIEAVVDLPDTTPTLPDTRFDIPVDIPLPDVDTSGATCQSDDDCDYFDDCCYDGWCYSGVCQIKYKQACCAVEGPCATVVPLHTATCEAQCEDRGCVSRLKLAQDGCDEVLFEYHPGAPEAEASLTFVDDRPQDDVAWHVTARRGLGGGLSLHAGHRSCPTYHTGPLDAACQPVGSGQAAAVRLALETPSFLVPQERPTVARLWLWAALEDPADPGNRSQSTFDGLDASVVTPSGFVSARWSSRDAPLPRGEWTPVLLDLSDFAAEEVSLRLVFDTLDGVDNHHEGVYVGEIQIGTACDGARECPPEAPCAVGRLVPVAPIGDALCVTAPQAPGEPCQACASAADCAVADGCEAASCEGGRCVVTRELTAACCTPDDAWPDPPGFEAPLGEGWILDQAGPAAWHVSDARAHTGTSALRFGLLDGPGLAPAGEAAAAAVWSPPLTVPSEVPALTFATWIATEWDAAPSRSNPAGVDLFEVLVAPAGLDAPPTVVWDSTALGGTTAGAWVEVAVSLDALAGLPVRVGFRFATGDEAANDGEGIYVDDVAVVRACPTCDPASDPACDPDGGDVTGPAGAGM